MAKTVKNDMDLADLLYGEITSLLPSISQDLGGRLADRLCDRLLSEPALPVANKGLLHEIEAMGRINRALYEMGGLGGTGIPQMPNRSLSQLADKIEAASKQVNHVLRSYENDRQQLYTLQHERRIVRSYFGVKE
jgi:hypothetical protein